jgi:hypothetical protein
MSVSVNCVRCDDEIELDEVLCTDCASTDLRSTFDKLVELAREYMREHWLMSHIGGGCETCDKFADPQVVEAMKGKV